MRRRSLVVTIVIWLTVAVAILLIAGISRADDRSKTLTARELRKAEMAQRRELVTSAAISQAAERRERLKARREMPVFVVFVPYAATRNRYANYRPHWTSDHYSSIHFEPWHHW